MTSPAIDPGPVLSVPEVAQALGTKDSTVRTALRDRRLLATSAAEGRAGQIPAAFLVDSPNKPGLSIILPSLHGTILALVDLGLTDREAFAWLFTANDALDMRTPIEALRAGDKHTVRRAVVFAL